MIGHHGDVGAPFFLQTDENAHADAVNASLSHTVETVDAPFEVGLHAARMVNVVVGLVIGFLKTNHAVHAVLAQFGVFFCRERHHLNLQIGEIGLRQVKGFRQVRHTSLRWILTRHEQQILKGCQLLDGLVLTISSSVKIVRFILLATWKPQYTQELVQELVIYSGINMDTVRPKRSSVYRRLKRAIVSK